MIIRACNNTETTVDTYELWCLLDTARRAFKDLACDKNIEGDEFVRWYEGGIECLRAQQHIERVLGGVTITTGA